MPHGTVGVIFLTLVAALATPPPTLIVLDSLAERLSPLLGRRRAEPDQRGNG